MEPHPRILLVEDDAYDARLTRRALEQHSFVVEHVERGDQVVDAVRRLGPDLVLLDLMLPVMTGIEACKAIRTFSDVPVIMLTGLDDDQDQIAGLGVGADDYVSKPVVGGILVARIRSLLRRSKRQVSSEGMVLEAGPLRIDEDLREVRVGAEVLDLSSAEFDLLLLFSKHAGEVLDREFLYPTLRGIPYDGHDRSMDLRVSRLRAKLGDDAGRLLRSVRGRGYVLTVPRPV
jgi:two-component system response regulator RstA